MTSGPITLRGHHLLCVLTYRGMGYSPAFVTAMTHIVDRLSSGERFDLVEGPDSICFGHEPGCSSANHCNDERTVERDHRALADISRIAPHLLIQRCFSSDTLTEIRNAFADGSARSACGGCEWSSLCGVIAEAQFADARLTATS